LVEGDQRSVEFRREARSLQASVVKRATAHRFVSRGLDGRV
jgi:hypothetical protein